MEDVGRFLVGSGWFWLVWVGFGWFWLAMLDLFGSVLCWLWLGCLVAYLESLARIVGKFASHFCWASLVDR